MRTTHGCIGVCLGASALLLSACTQPSVRLKPPASQDSENTVRDWDAVAHKITAQMEAQRLLPARAAPQNAPVPPPPRPVFVRVQAPNSAFLREVAGEIEADVLRRGGTVSRTMTDATVVNLGVSFVQWSPRDKPPGLLGTGLAAAVVTGAILADAGPYSYAGGLTAAGIAAGIVGVAADFAVAMTPWSNSEAVWEATIVSADKVIMSLREPVYIRNGDIGLYATRADLAPALSWSESRRLPAVPVRYQP
jgi:hypothetical protein